MDLMKKISELNSIIDGNIDTAGWFFLVTIVLLIVLKFFTGILADGSAGKGIRMTTAAILLSIVGISLYCGYLLYDMKKVEKEIAVIEQEFYSTLEETETIEVGLVLTTHKSVDYLCPHVILKENEECTYVKFISEGEVSEVFIPLEKDALSKADLPLNITYVSLTKEEYEFLNEHLHINQIDFTESKVQRDFFGYILSKWFGEKKTPFVDSKRWALGVSINK